MRFDGKTIVFSDRIVHCQIHSLHPLEKEGCYKSLFEHPGAYNLISREVDTNGCLRKYVRDGGKGLSMLFLSSLGDCLLRAEARVDALRYDYYRMLLR